MKKILLILMLLSLTNCASNQTKSHMSSVIGAGAGYGMCRAALESGIALTAGSVQLLVLGQVQVYFIMMI